LRAFDGPRRTIISEEDSTEEIVVFAVSGLQKVVATC
jgi:hypothetical protein